MVASQLVNRPFALRLLLLCVRLLILALDLLLRFLLCLFLLLLVLLFLVLLLLVLLLLLWFWLLTEPPHNRLERLGPLLYLLGCECRLVVRLELFLLRDALIQPFAELVDSLDRRRALFACDPWPLLFELLDSFLELSRLHTSIEDSVRPGLLLFGTQQHRRRHVVHLRDLLCDCLPH